MMTDNQKQISNNNHKKQEEEEEVEVRNVEYNTEQNQRNGGDYIYAIVAGTAISGVLAAISTAAPLTSAVLFTAFAAACMKRQSKKKESQEEADSEKNQLAQETDQVNLLHSAGTRDELKYSAILPQHQQKIRTAQNQFRFNHELNIQKHATATFQLTRKDQRTSFNTTPQNVQSLIQTFSQDHRDRTHEQNFRSFVLQEIQNSHFKLHNLNVFCDLNSVDMSQISEHIQQSTKNPTANLIKQIYCKKSDIQEEIGLEDNNKDLLKEKSLQQLSILQNIKSTNNNLYESSNIIQDLNTWQIHKYNLPSMQYLCSEQMKDTPNLPSMQFLCSDPNQPSMQYLCSEQIKGTPNQPSMQYLCSGQIKGTSTYTPTHTPTSIHPALNLNTQNNQISDYKKSNKTIKTVGQQSTTKKVEFNQKFHKQEDLFDLKSNFSIDVGNYNYAKQFSVEYQGSQRNNTVFIQDEFEINSNDDENIIRDKVALDSSQFHMEKSQSISLRLSSSSLNSGDELVSPQPLNNSVQKFFTSKKIDSFLLDIDFEFEFQTSQQEEFFEFDSGFRSFSEFGDDNSVSSNKFQNLNQQNSLILTSSNFQKTQFEQTKQIQQNLIQQSEFSKIFLSSNSQNNQEIHKFNSAISDSSENHQTQFQFTDSNQYEVKFKSENDFYKAEQISDEHIKFENIPNSSFSINSNFLSSESHEIQKQHSEINQKQKSAQKSNDSGKFKRNSSWSSCQFKKLNYLQSKFDNLSKKMSDRFQRGTNSKSFSSFGTTSKREKATQSQSQVSKTTLQNQFDVEKQQSNIILPKISSLHPKQNNINSENTDLKFLSKKQQTKNQHGKISLKNKFSAEKQYTKIIQPSVYKLNKKQDIIKSGKSDLNFSYKQSTDNRQNNFMHIDTLQTQNKLIQKMVNSFDSYKNYQNNNYLSKDFKLKFEQVPQVLEFWKNLENQYVGQFISRKKNLKIILDDFPAQYPQIFSPQTLIDGPNYTSNKSTKSHEKNLQTQGKSIYKSHPKFFNQFLYQNTKNQKISSFELESLTQKEISQFENIQDNNLKSTQNQNNILLENPEKQLKNQNEQNFGEQNLLNLMQISNSNQNESNSSDQRNFKNLEILKNSKLSGLIRSFEFKPQDQQMQHQNVKFENQNQFKSTKLDQMIKNYKFSNQNDQESENSKFTQNIKIDKIIRNFEYANQNHLNNFENLSLFEDNENSKNNTQNELSFEVKDDLKEEEENINQINSGNIDDYELNIQNIRMRKTISEEFNDITNLQLVTQNSTTKNVDSRRLLDTDQSVRDFHPELKPRQELDCLSEENLKNIVMDSSSLKDSMSDVTWELFPDEQPQQLSQYLDDLPLPQTLATRPHQPPLLSTSNVQSGSCQSDVSNWILSGSRSAIERQSSTSSCSINNKSLTTFEKDSTINIRQNKLYSDLSVKSNSQKFSNARDVSYFQNVSQNINSKNLFQFTQNEKNKNSQQDDELSILDLIDNNEKLNCQNSSHCLQQQANDELRISSLIDDNNNNNINRQSSSQFLALQDALHSFETENLSLSDQKTDQNKNNQNWQRSSIALLFGGKKETFDSLKQDLDGWVKQKCAVSSCLLQSKTKE